AAPITCSQLSSTTSSCSRASTPASASVAGTPGRSRPPSTAAATAGTSAGSPAGASSTSHTPSANRPATCLATSPASRVLPTPPGPVTVTSRYSSSKPATSRTAPARPTKLVSTAGKPSTPAAAIPAAAPPIPVPYPQAASQSSPTPPTSAQERELAAGWLSLLAATSLIDLHRDHAAAACLRPAAQLAREAEYAEIATWCLETQASQVLTEGDYRRAVDIAQAAQQVAPKSGSAFI